MKEIIITTNLKMKNEYKKDNIWKKKWLNKNIVNIIMMVKWKIVDKIWKYRIIWEV